MRAYSEHTGQSYPSWDDLVAAEANGYVVVSISTRPGTAPAVFGPYIDKADARRAHVRIARKTKKEEAPYRVFTYTRLLWKDSHQPKE